MAWQDIITLDPTVLAGKPVVRNTRLSVDFIVGLLGQGWTEADILKNYPGLTREDIAACLQYASEVLGAERVYPIAPVARPKGLLRSLAKFRATMPAWRKPSATLLRAAREEER